MSQWLENLQGGPTWGQPVYACKYLHITMRLLKCSKILPVAFIGHVNAEGSYRAWVMIHGDFCRRRVDPLRREGWGLWPYPCSRWAPPGMGCCLFVQEIPCRSLLQVHGRSRTLCLERTCLIHVDVPFQKTRNPLLSRRCFPVILLTSAVHFHFIYQKTVFLNSSLTVRQIHALDYILCY